MIILSLLSPFKLIVFTGIHCSSEEIKLESLGYSTPTEIVLKINNLGMKYAEIGVKHFERKGGVSKLKIINTGWGFIKVLFYLKIKFHLKNKKLIK